VWPEGLGKLEKSTSSGRDPATFRLVALCLNHYATACPLCILLTRLNESIHLFHLLNLYFHCLCIVSRDGTVGIATGYELDGREIGVRVPVWHRFFTSPLGPDGFWGPPSLLPMNSGGSYCRGKAPTSAEV
jgi:hypothetical protein